MAYQMKSEAGWPRYEPGVLVGSVFFRTNEWQLDKNDREVVRHIGFMAVSELGKGKPVEISLLAQSDHRGEACDNLRLSDRRLRSVVDVLAGTLSLRPDFRQVWAASVGEALDVFNSNDREVLARHRRVIVFWGKFDMSDLKRTFKLPHLLDVQRYDLLNGFVKRTESAFVRHQHILQHA